MKHTPLIRLERVSKHYILENGDRYPALTDITLTIGQGEFAAIMGPSGSGKSTLMHILGALDTASSGCQFFRDRDISAYSPNQLAEIRNRDIGFVFQSFNLLPRTSVLKNVERPMVYGGIEKNERRQRALEMLALMKIADKAESMSNRLSGGQVQRVAIARALVMDPAIILADEPTGNLDTKTAHEIMEFIKELNKKGKTIVVITHEEDIARYAHRQIRLLDGRVVSDTHT